MEEIFDANFFDILSTYLLWLNFEFVRQLEKRLCDVQARFCAVRIATLARRKVSAVLLEPLGRLFEFGSELGAVGELNLIPDRFCVV